MVLILLTQYFLHYLLLVYFIQVPIKPLGIIKGNMSPTYLLTRLVLLSVVAIQVTEVLNQLIVDSSLVG